MYTIDGLVHVSDLTDDFYFFDEKNLRYIGQRTGKVFKMSDCVKVRVASASKIDKSVDFEIVGMKSNKKTQKTVIINSRKDDKRKKGHSKFLQILHLYVFPYIQQFSYHQLHAQYQLLHALD